MVPPISAKVLEKQVDELVERFKKLADTLNHPKFVESIPQQKIDSAPKEAIAEARKLRSIPEEKDVPKVDQPNRADEAKATPKETVHGEKKDSEDAVLGEKEVPKKVGFSKESNRKEEMAKKPVESVPVPSLKETKETAREGETDHKMDDPVPTLKPTTIRPETSQNAVKVDVVPGKESVRKEETISKSDGSKEKLKESVTEVKRDSVNKESDRLSKKVFCRPHGS